MTLNTEFRLSNIPLAALKQGSLDLARQIRSNYLGRTNPPISLAGKSLESVVSKNGHWDCNSIEFFNLTTSDRFLKNREKIPFALELLGSQWASLPTETLAEISNQIDQIPDSPEVLKNIFSLYYPKVQRNAEAEEIEIETLFKNCKPAPLSALSYILETFTNSNCSSQILAYATQANDLDAFEFAIKRGGNPNFATKDQKTPLSISIENENLPMFTSLANHPLVDFDQIVNHKMTPLHLIAAKTNDHIFNVVLSDTKNVDSIDEWGETPFMLASKSGTLNNVKRLHEKTHKKNSVNQKNETAFFLAVSNDHPDVVSYMLQIPDINPNIPDRFQQTPLIKAAKGRYLRNLVKVQSLLVVELLLADPRVRLNSTDHLGRTALHYAVCEQHVEVTRALLANQNTDVGIRDQRDKTAGDYALSSYRDSHKKSKKAKALEILLMFQPDFIPQC